MRAAREDRGEARELSLRVVETGVPAAGVGAGRQCAGERSLVAARERVEPLGVLADLVPRDEPLPLLPSERARGHEAAEVAIARAALDEKRQADGLRVLLLLPAVSLFFPDGTRCVQDEFRPHERPEPGGARGLVEARRAEDARDVDERHRGKPAAGGLLDEVLRERCAIQEGEGGRGAQLGVRARREPRRGGPPRALPELLLPRARRHDLGDERPDEIAGGRGVPGRIGRPAAPFHPPTLGVNPSQVNRCGRCKTIRPLGRGGACPRPHLLRSDFDAPPRCSPYMPARSPPHADPRRSGRGDSRRASRRAGGRPRPRSTTALPSS